MSSDYIPRLRHELLRAGASTQSPLRRRPRVTRGLRPLAAVAAIAAVVVLVVAVWPEGVSDESAVKPAAATLELTYRVEPAGSAAADRTAQVMRLRLEEAGIDGARVSVSSSASLAITAPPTARDAVTALVQRGRVAIYDWENSVLGPGRAPAPTDTSVTGGPDAGRAAAITRAQAERRAAGQQGGHIVHAENPAGWFVLGGEPALTDADIDHAISAVDPATKQPFVAFEFTAPGKAAFSTLTRELARRAAARAADGLSDLDAAQHFAIVIDDQIVSVPFIDFRQAPDGIDGSAGAQIQGDMTPQRTHQIATILDTGPLPAALIPERSGS